MQTVRRTDYYWRSKDFTPAVYNPLDLAYFAGIIDGEGCFFIQKIKKSGWFQGQLKIDNTDKKLIEWIENVFPGHSSGHLRWTSKRAYERTVHSWVCTGDRLLDISDQVLPYLVIKKPHCENMIKFRTSYQERRGNLPIPSDILAIREECLITSRHLNSRYHQHPLKGNL